MLFIFLFQSFYLLHLFFYSFFHLFFHCFFHFFLTLLPPRFHITRPRFRSSTAFDWNRVSITFFW
ncbi:hypothetical protein F7O84_13155 [Candidatus Galacturonibacter soehngenii]|uniref:Uncharacterized protein n=1 Tax=Candidatus Galacturonatibacter soehngenii TaxID=2307010 RepID=A0A7V7QKW1_9FIRM|nr:hypothetical protein F7O84_13155 [Candidatus Galacturonibacter soehngenii]